MTGRPPLNRQGAHRMMQCELVWVNPSVACVRRRWGRGSKVKPGNERSACQVLPTHCRVRLPLVVVAFLCFAVSFRFVSSFFALFRFFSLSLFFFCPSIPSALPHASPCFPRLPHASLLLLPPRTFVTSSSPLWVPSLLRFLPGHDAHPAARVTHPAAVYLESERNLNFWPSLAFCLCFLLRSWAAEHGMMG